MHACARAAGALAVRLRVPRHVRAGLALTSATCVKRIFRHVAPSTHLASRPSLDFIYPTLLVFKRALRSLTIGLPRLPVLFSVCLPRAPSFAFPLPPNDIVPARAAVRIIF